MSQPTPQWVFGKNEGTPWDCAFPHPSSHVGLDATRVWKLAPKRIKEITSFLMGGQKGEAQFMAVCPGTASLRLSVSDEAGAQSPKAAHRPLSASPNTLE